MKVNIVPSLFGLWSGDNPHSTKNWEASKREMTRVGLRNSRERKSQKGITVKSKIGNAKLRAEGCAMMPRQNERKKKERGGPKKMVRTPKIYSNLSSIISYIYFEKVLDGNTRFYFILMALRLVFKPTQSLRSPPELPADKQSSDTSQVFIQF